MPVCAVSCVTKQEHTELRRLTTITESDLLFIWEEMLPHPSGLLIVSGPDKERSRPCILDITNKNMRRYLWPVVAWLFQQSCYVPGTMLKVPVV